MSTMLASMRPTQYRDAMQRSLDDVHVADQPPRIRWGVVVLLFAVAFVARFAYFYLDDLSRQLHGTFVQRLLEEGTGNLASLVFFPIVVIVERRFPLDRDRWRHNWLPHIGGYVAYSAAHTTFIALSRAVIFPALGHGAYDYGLMSVRYFMEAAQDLFSYTAFIAVLTLIRVQQRLRERDVRAARLERDAAEARLEALTLRLQPHFLFNALNTISSTVYENPAAADDLIGQLGELLRRSLRTTDRQEITLAEELELLHAYEALIEARFGERVHFEHHVPDDVRDLAMPAFLLQPLVENAVHHGTDSEFAPTHVVLRVSTDGQSLHLVVENTARVPLAEPERHGTGLGATIARLHLMYGEAGSLQTSIVNDRFRVSVRIPAHRLDPVSPTEEIPAARAHR